MDSRAWTSAKAHAPMQRHGCQCLPPLWWGVAALTAACDPGFSLWAGEWESAVKGILAARPDDRDDVAAARRLFFEAGDPAGAAQQLPMRMGAERACLQVCRCPCVTRHSAFHVWCMWCILCLDAVSHTSRHLDARLRRTVLSLWPCSLLIM